MRDIAFVFFLAAVLCVSAGMIWGIQMAISQDRLLSGAHVHLNLVGWTTMALFGLYHRLTPVAAATFLAPPMPLDIAPYHGRQAAVCVGAGGELVELIAG